MNFNNDNKFDFEADPKFINGQLMEQIFGEHITNFKFEVKSENQKVWNKSGNIYIEFEQFINGKWTPSGISVTEAEYWVQILKNFDDEFIVPILLPTKWLNERIRTLLKNKIASISGKDRTEDGTATRGYLIPLKWLYITDDEVEQYSNMERKHISNKIKNLKNK